jgi:hypothetical protein
MASVDGAVAAGRRTGEVTQEDVDELREHYEELNKTNALLDLENDVFEAYLLRHNQVNLPRSVVVAVQLPHFASRAQQIDDEAEEEEEDMGGRRRGRRRAGKKSKHTPDLKAGSFPAASVPGADVMASPSQSKSWKLQPMSSTKHRRMLMGEQRS